MFTTHWRAFGVMMAAVLGFSILVARAEEDPFGDLEPGVAGAEVKASENAAAAASSKSDPQKTNPGACRCIGESKSESVARIEKALSSPLTSAGLDFAETPLEQVVAFLQHEYNLPIQIDAAALEATGLDTSEPVTIQLRDVSLRSALQLMLKKLQLVYVIQHEVLMITTPEQAESQLLTCIYDVRNLVEKPTEPKGASAWADYDPLVGAITECVAPDTWEENGKGEGDIRSIGPGFLVIYQTRAVHEQISQMLATLREMRQSAPASAQ